MKFGGGLMNSNRCCMKNIKINFIQKWKLLILEVLLLAVIGSVGFLFITFKERIHLVIIIITGVIFMLALWGTLMSAFNGMLLTAKNIWFVPDVRLRRFRVHDVELISILFIKQSNKKFAARIEIRLKDGTIIKKDYTQQLTYAKHRSLQMSVYTVSEKQVNNIKNKCKDNKNSIINIT